MAKNLDDFKTELTLYQCCIADLAYNYAKYRAMGRTKDMDCLFNKISFGVTTINTLKCFVPTRSETLSSATMVFTDGSPILPWNATLTATVDGVQILNVAYTGGTYSGFLDAVRDYINNNTSVPDYTAVRNGDIITIKATTGTGSGPNGFILSTVLVVDATDGDITMVPSNFTGGLYAVTSSNQCISDTEAEALLEQLNLICGCVRCEDSTSLLDDDVTDSSNLLLQENTGYIALE